VPRKWQARFGGGHTEKVQKWNLAGCLPYFHADNLSLWSKLEGKPANIGKQGATKDTVQLRFEGIDAIEKGATKPLSTQARDEMFGLIGFDPASSPEPRGFILTRMTDDEAGRPICFVFSGTTNRQDGADVFLDAAMLRDTVNHKLAKAGFAYPLYYHTLFAELRNEFSQAVADARTKGRGNWPVDRTQQGATVTSRADLATIPPIWPKLWRRLDDFFRNNASLSGFIPFLEAKDERVEIISIVEERGLQDVVAVQGNRVRLTEPPENLRVVARAGRRLR
jgi:hypothetical protein